MQFLVIGANGFIGGMLYRFFVDSGYETFGTSRMGSDILWRYDITQDSVEELIRRKNLVSSDLKVIICAAVAKFNDCYNNPIYSYAVNVSGTVKCIEELEKMKIYYIVFSSEAIFDGQKGLYTEQDLAKPILTYGRQKWEMECAVRKIQKKGLILRISKVVDVMYRPGHILIELFDNIRCGKVIRCIEGQCFTPLYVRDLAIIIRTCAERSLVGTYHVSNGEMILRSTMAELMCDGMGIKTQIEVVKMDFFNFPEPRYIRGGLDNSKLQKTIFHQYMSTGTMIKKFLDNANKEIEGNYVEVQ